MGGEAKGFNSSWLKTCRISHLCLVGDVPVGIRKGADTTHKDENLPDASKHHHQDQNQNPQLSAQALSSQQQSPKPVARPCNRGIFNEGLLWPNKGGGQWVEQNPANCFNFRASKPLCGDVTVPF